MTRAAITEVTVRQKPKKAVWEVLGHTADGNKGIIAKFNTEEEAETYASQKRTELASKAFDGFLRSGDEG